MTSHTVTLDIENPIAYLTLNRVDKKNALNMTMWQEIERIAKDVEQNPDIHVLVIRSASDTVFCAGADISEFQIFMNDAEACEQNRKAIRAACDGIENLSIPTIAMIQGPCVGGGCALALCCDFRFGDDKSRYGITPAKLGIVYGLSDTRRLMDLVGPSEAKMVLFAANIFNADKALRIGLVNDIFPAEELAEEVGKFTRQLMSNSPHSLKNIKANVKRILSGDREDDELSETLFRESFTGKDHREGVDAFLNKRKPEFR